MIKGSFRKRLARLDPHSEDDRLLNLDDWGEGWEHLWGRGATVGDLKRALAAVNGATRGKLPSECN